MLIECLIERDGPTYVTLDKFDYVFRGREDCGGAVVCDVTNDSHAERFLSMPKCYRKHDGERPTESPDPKPLPGLEAGDDEGADEDQGPDEEEPAAMTDTELDETIMRLHGENLSYAKIGELVDRSKSCVARRVKALKGGGGA